jgi:hypothetical protein
LAALSKFAGFDASEMTGSFEIVDSETNRSFEISFAALRERAMTELKNTFLVGIYKCELTYTSGGGLARASAADWWSFVCNAQEANKELVSAGQEGIRAPKLRCLDG